MTEDRSLISTQEMRDRLVVLAGEIAYIKSQIEEAKAKKHIIGERADADWFRRANLALRLKGRDYQALQFELGQRTKEERQNRQVRIETAFVQAARQYLSKEEFTKILDAAHLLIGK